MAMFAAWIPNRKWDVSFTTNGFLAGLVAITCPCYWVSPTGAVILGGIAGVIVYLGVELLGISADRRSDRCGSFARACAASGEPCRSASSLRANLGA